MVFAHRRIPPKFMEGALSADTMGGRPRKTYGSVHEALDNIFKPILVTLSDHLTKNGCSELIPLLPKYILFKVMLGMWRPPLPAREKVHRWVDLLPSRTALVCDSYFGSHAVANQLARRQHPFLFLTRRDQEGVAAAGDSLLPGQVAEAYVGNGGYSLHFFKNPKAGSKPPRVGPFVSNCQYDGMGVPHRGAYSLPPIVAAYRQLAYGVDSANQLALEHRETGRFKCWSKALKAFLYRYAIVNTFTIARCQGLISHKKSLWDFQWDLLESYVPNATKCTHLCW